jgi:undecaprenyl-diphosphatase
LADSATLLQAAVLGVVEGITEFLPVSSTGHLILAGHLLGFAGPPGKVFEVVIQLGAIVAVCLLYFDRLLRVALRLPYDPAARRFVLSLLAGFLPAMVLGVLFRDTIKTVLFSPWVVVCTLVAGGVLILLIEGRLRPAEPLHHDAEALPLALALKVGLCQAVAMVPGVSRSGATILGGVLLGVERKAAAEFSFFLAIPTMLAATVYDLYKVGPELASGDLATIGVGFLLAMATAMLVVRALIAFLARHTFRVFGWYRIAAGLAMAAVLLAYG